MRTDSIRLPWPRQQVSIDRYIDRYAPALDMEDQISNQTIYLGMLVTYEGKKPKFTDTSRVQYLGYRHGAAERWKGRVHYLGHRRGAARRGRRVEGSCSVSRSHKTRSPKIVKRRSWRGAERRGGRKVMSSISATGAARRKSRVQYPEAILVRSGAARRKGGRRSTRHRACVISLFSI